MEEAAKTAQIKLNDNDINRLEFLAEKVGISTLREWEKDMEEKCIK